MRGCKPTSNRTRISTSSFFEWGPAPPLVANRHPTEQGFQPMPDDLVEQIDEELQTDIQQNKDFNPERPTRPSRSGRLQTDIQQNKDFNLCHDPGMRLHPDGCKPTSNRTRIQTRNRAGHPPGDPWLRTNFHQNKDPNHPYLYDGG